MMWFHKNGGPRTVLIPLHLIINVQSDIRWFATRDPDPRIHGAPYDPASRGSLRLYVLGGWLPTPSAAFFEIKKRIIWLDDIDKKFFVRMMRGAINKRTAGITAGRCTLCQCHWFGYELENHSPLECSLYHHTRQQRLYFMAANNVAYCHKCRSTSHHHLTCSGTKHCRVCLGTCHPPHVGICQDTTLHGSGFVAEFRKLQKMHYSFCQQHQHTFRFPLVNDTPNVRIQSIEKMHGIPPFQDDWGGQRKYPEITYPHGRYHGMAMATRNAAIPIIRLSPDDMVRLQLFGDRLDEYLRNEDYRRRPLLPPVIPSHDFARWNIRAFPGGSRQQIQDSRGLTSSLASAQVLAPDLTIVPASSLVSRALAAAPTSSPTLALASAPAPASTMVLAPDPSRSLTLAPSPAPAPAAPHTARSAPASTHSLALAPASAPASTMVLAPAPSRSLTLAPSPAPAPAAPQTPRPAPASTPSLAMTPVPTFAPKMAPAPSRSLTLAPAPALTRVLATELAPARVPTQKLSQLAASDTTSSNNHATSSLCDSSRTDVSVFSASTVNTGGHVASIFKPVTSFRPEAVLLLPRTKHSVAPEVLTIPECKEQIRKCPTQSRKDEFMLRRWILVHADKGTLETLPTFQTMFPRWQLDELQKKPMPTERSALLERLITFQRLLTASGEEDYEAARLLDASILADYIARLVKFVESLVLRQNVYMVALEEDCLEQAKRGLLFEMVKRFPSLVLYNQGGKDVLDEYEKYHAGTGPGMKITAEYNMWRCPKQVLHTGNAEYECRHETELAQWVVATNDEREKRRWPSGSWPPTTNERSVAGHSNHHQRMISR